MIRIICHFYILFWRVFTFFILKICICQVFIVWSKYMLKIKLCIGEICVQKWTLESVLNHRLILSLFEYSLICLFKFLHSFCLCLFFSCQTFLLLGTLLWIWIWNQCVWFWPWKITSSIVLISFLFAVSIHRV